jgi:hypothetical protein
MQRPPALSPQLPYKTVKGITVVGKLREACMAQGSVVEHGVGGSGRRAAWVEVGRGDRTDLVRVGAGQL